MSIWNLIKAHILALNTAHVLRLNKADVLALSKAHVLHLNNKICPVFKANTKETTKEGGRSLFVGSEHWAYLIVETQDMCLVESQEVGRYMRATLCPRKTPRV